MNKNVIVIGLLPILILLYHNSFAQEIPRVEYTSSDLRDPLKNPLEVKETEIKPSKGKVTEKIYLPKNFLVQGIVWGRKPVRAIINDRVVGKGDTVLDVQVLDIKEGEIYLLYKDKEFIIKP